MERIIKKILIACIAAISCSTVNVVTIVIKKRDINSNVMLSNYYFEANKSAVIVVDMWNGHHCKPAQDRAEKLAIKIESFLGKIRKKGVQIIFAPSDTMEYYVSSKNRKKIQKLLTSKSDEIKK